MENTFFVIAGVIIVLIFLFSIGVIHIRSLRDDINIKWYNLLDKLQYRQDLVPNLIETVWLFLSKDELSKHDDLIQETIEIRRKSAKQSDPGPDKIIFEHDLSKHIKQIFTLGKSYDALGTSTNFLELRKNFAEISEEIESISSEYNKEVRHHNSIIRRPYNVVPAVIMNYKNKQIFEFE